MEIDVGVELSFSAFSVRLGVAIMSNTCFDTCREIYGIMLGGALLNYVDKIDAEIVVSGTCRSSLNCIFVSLVLTTD